MHVLGRAIWINESINHSGALHTAPEPPGLMTAALWRWGFSSTSRSATVAINSETELMKGEINQTQRKETCSFEPPAQAAHLQPERVNIWVTDGCCRWRTSSNEGKNSVLSVKFGFGINIKVTRAASVGFLTLVCFLVVFFKAANKLKCDAWTCLQRLTSKPLILRLVLCSAIHPIPHGPLHEFIHRLVGGERLPVTTASEEVESVWLSRLQQEWWVSQPSGCSYLNTHQPPEPCWPGASLQITPKSVTHQTQTQQECFFPKSLRFPSER